MRCILKFVVLAITWTTACPVWGQVEHVDMSKSEGTAAALSILGTIVPVAAGKLIAGNPESGTEPRALVGGSIALCGAIFGPALGYIYAGNEHAIGLGATLRMTGLTSGVVAKLLYDNYQTSGTGSWVDDALAVSGGVLFVGGTLLDWIRAPALLRSQKESARPARVHRIEVHPTVSGVCVLVRVG